MLDQLHDYSVRNISVDWHQSMITINVGTYDNDQPKDVVIKFIGFRNLHVPHQCPWGKSNLINEVREKSGINYKSVEIEMQSGDVILIEYSEHHFSV